MAQILRLLLVLFSGASLAACDASSEASDAAPVAVDQGAASSDAPHMLVFSYTTGWRHDSIETGVEALKALGAREGYIVEATENPYVFSKDGLKDVDVLILLNTTSNSREEGQEWFTGERRDALQAFVHRGGGVVAIHGASDSHYNWPWYGRMIGGYFLRHPQGTPHGALHVVDGNDPSTRKLPATFERDDEWYWIKDFNPEVHVLITLDPTSINEPDVNPKPISWRHEFEGGRVFYTAMGHTKETYADPLFLDHVAGGIRWALGRED